MPAYKDTNTGKWYAKFYYQTDGGRKQKLKRGFDLKRQAEQYERDFLRIHNNENTILLSDLKTAFIEDLQKRGRAVTTVISYENRLDLLLQHYGALSAGSITTEQITDILPELEENYSMNTRATVLRIWGALFSFGVKKYKLPSNPVSAISKPTEKTTTENFWTLEQFQTFRAVCKNDSVSALCLEIIYYTGLRHGELLGLQVQDVDLTEGKLYINATRDSYGRRKPKSTTSCRVVYLSPYVTGLLRDHINRMYYKTPETLLFSVSQSTLLSYLKRKAELAGLPVITVHGLRHSHASLLINNKTDITAIADRLGHSSPVITSQVYTHLFDDRRKEVAEQIQNIIDGTNDN